MQGAWKVGVLVVLFVGLVIGGYAVLGRSLFAPPGALYYANFADANGLTQGTSVQMAGVKIGAVKSVKLVNPQLAQVTMELKPEVHIPVGSSATLTSALIGIGDQPVNIVPPAKLTENYIPVGSTIPGVKTSAIENLLPDAKTTIKELNKTLVATQNLLQDQKLKNGVTQLLESSNKTVAQFGLLAQQANGLIGKNQATLQRAINTAALAVEDIRKSTQQVALLAQDQRWKDKAFKLMDSLNETAGHANKLVQSLDAFVNDPKLREPLNATLANTQQITESGTKIADSGTRIAASTEEIAKNGIVISQKAIEFADKANQLADEAKTTLQKINGVFGKKPSAGPLGNISASLDLVRETKPNHWRTDVEATVPLKDTTVHVGLFDAFETNKVTLQLGKQFGGGDGEFRYGIYASKPGVGVDYRLAPRLFARADLFDINNPRADVRMRYEFGNGFYGWLGLDHVLKYNGPVIGVGFRR